MSFRALGSSVSLRLPPMPGTFALGANPPEVIDRNEAPRMAGEPSLAAALSRLSAEEASDYKTWGQPEKLQFLGGYQYLAVMSAAGLRRPDGTAFDGMLSKGISTAFASMKAMLPYIKAMQPSQAEAADQLASILKDASTKTEPRATDFSQKYSLLRDRVAWELATQNDLTIEYEIVGTDPANPGVIYTRKIGENRAPDYSAVFSTRTPKELFDDGLVLQDKFENLGVSFKKFDMSGLKLRLGAGAPAILAALIAIVVLILGFYWMWNQVNRQNDLTNLAVNFISSDPNLSASEKAARIAQLQGTNSFFSQIFGSSFPWTTVLLILGFGALVYFAYPYVFDQPRGGFLSEGRA